MHDRSSDRIYVRSTRLQALSRPPVGRDGQVRCATLMKGGLKPALRLRSYRRPEPAWRLRSLLSCLAHASFLATQAREPGRSASAATRATRCVCAAAAARGTCRRASAPPAGTPPPASAAVRAVLVACSARLTLLRPRQTTGVRRRLGARRRGRADAGTSRRCRASSRTASARVRTLSPSGPRRLAPRSDARRGQPPLDQHLAAARSCAGPLATAARRGLRLRSARTQRRVARTSGRRWAGGGAGLSPRVYLASADARPQARRRSPCP